MIPRKSRVVVVARIIRRHGAKNYVLQGKISRQNERAKLKSNLRAEQKAPELGSRRRQRYDLLNHFASRF